MDPNETLSMIRALVADLAQPETNEVRTDAIERLPELFAALDTHLSAGGSPPEEWREGPDAPANDTERNVVVVGNPSDGFTYYGPFSTDETDSFTEDLNGSQAPYWWIATLHTA